MASGELVFKIGKEFKMADVQQAHDVFEKRKYPGRVILKI